MQEAPRPAADNSASAGRAPGGAHAEPGPPEKAEARARSPCDAAAEGAARQQPAADTAAGVATPLPDLSQALPEGVLLSVISGLDLIDSVSLSSTCRRLQTLVAQRLSSEAGGPSSPAGGARGGSGGGGHGAGARAPPDAGSAAAAIAATLRRASALACAAASGEWREQLLLPAAASAAAAAAAQQQGRRGGGGGGGGGGRGGGRAPPAPVEQAAYLGLSSRVISECEVIFTDGRLTALCEFTDRHRVTQAPAPPGDTEAGAPPPGRPPPRGAEAGGAAPAGGSDEFRLLQGHAPARCVAAAFADPPWHAPGRRWGRLQHAVAAPAPRPGAGADEFAEWPPRAGCDLGFARWMAPAPGEGVLVAPRGGGGDAERARRTLGAALEALSSSGLSDAPPPAPGSGPAGAGALAFNTAAAGAADTSSRLALCFVDVSGQSQLDDASLAALARPGLAALNLAGTAAGGITFMVLGAGGGWDAGVLAVASAPPPRAAAPPSPQQHRRPGGALAPPCRPAAVASAAANAPAPLPPAPPDGAGAQALRALDVSRCASLAPGAPAALFRLFQAALGRLPGLEELVIQGCDVDLALPAATLPGFANPAAAPPTAPAPSAAGAPRGHAAPPPACGGRGNGRGGSSERTGSGGSCGGEDLPPWALTASRLSRLDVSDAAALSPESLAALLRLAAPRMRRLRAAGCRALAAARGSDGAAALRALVAPAPAPAASDACTDEHIPHADGAAQPPQRVALPSLHELTIGWGFAQSSTAAMLRASPFLTRLEAGLGAECSDGLLERLAGCCPELQDLTLRLAAVGTEGVCVVLAACRKLRALRLQHCSGPLDGAALLAAAERGGHRWSFEDLQLVGGAPSLLSDAQLLALLQAPGSCPGAAAAPSGPPSGSGGGGGGQRSEAGGGGGYQGLGCGGSRGGGSGEGCQDGERPSQVRALTEPVAPPRPPAAPGARAWRLHTLALVNVRGLTDGLLVRLAAAAAQLPLRHLRLEECVTAWPVAPAAAATASIHAQHAGGEDGAAAAAAAAAARPSFSEGAVLRLASRCPRLQSLRLRHAAAPLGAGFVAAAAAACPLLSRVALDRCDLAEGGFALPPDQYSALEVVQVVKCDIIASDHLALHEHIHSHGHGHGHVHAGANAGAESGGDAQQAAAGAGGGGGAEARAEGPPAAAAGRAGGGLDGASRRAVGRTLLTHYIQEGRTASKRLQ